MVEFAAHLFLVIGEGRHAHHAMDGHVLKFLEFGALQHFLALFERKPEFGFLVGDVELQQAGDDALVLDGGLVDLLEQRETVNAVNQRHIRGDVLDLVGLQMTDEVPFDVLGELRVFVTHLLSVVLTENALTVLVQRADVFRRFEFGNGDQARADGQGGPDFIVFFDVHTDGFSDPGGIQTHDFQNRNLTFYSAELRGRVSAAKVHFFPIY